MIDCFAPTELLLGGLPNCYHTVVPDGTFEMVQICYHTVVPDGTFEMVQILWGLKPRRGERMVKKDHFN